jgi:hypothetical integral membrane protein (TIGR02206 family)
MVFSARSQGQPALFRSVTQASGPAAQLRAGSGRGREDPDAGAAASMMRPGGAGLVEATVSPQAYWSCVVIAAIFCVVLCVEARRRPGTWTIVTARAIGLLLAADAVSYTVAQVEQGQWSWKSSLPLALCNVGVLVAAVACWWRIALLVELTYFWGLAGTLQAIITPDLNVGFPHLVFFQYVLGHTGIVLAALFLVVGLEIEPRPRAVPRVFAITAAYTAFVGLVDGLTGADYMFLRSPPVEWTLLRVLGPWPWYVVSAAGVGLVLFLALNSPFWWSRRHRDRTAGPSHPAPEPARANM